MIKIKKGMNLKTVEVSVETVAVGNITDKPHDEFPVDL